MKYKYSLSLEDRQKECQRMKTRYPDRIPCIVETRVNFPSIDKNKYLVPPDLTVGQFMSILRKRVKMEPSTAMFLFVNNTMPAGTHTIEQVHKNHAADDGFLYIEVSGEDTFGFYGY